MGGKNNCCRVEGCPTPPELQLEGLTQFGEWFELADCCWSARFFFDEDNPTVRYTGPTYSRKDYEYKGRITYKGAVGSRNSAGECVYTSQQDVAYRERWIYDYDSWRKFALYAIHSEVLVYCHRVMILEADVPVYYWYYKVIQTYTGQRGWERNRRTYNSTANVPLIECATFKSNNVSIDNNHSAQPGSSSWVEESFQSFECASYTYFRIAETDLEELDPGEWLERTVSSADDDIEPSSACTDGVQAPCVLDYYINEPFPCEYLSILDTAHPTTCSINIIRGEVEQFLIGSMVGFQTTNFGYGLYLVCGCIDIGSTCSGLLGGTPLSPTIFFYWDHEARIDINNCEKEWTPYDIVFHGVFNVRVRFPVP